MTEGKTNSLGEIGSIVDSELLNKSSKKRVKDLSGGNSLYKNSSKFMDSIVEEDSMKKEQGSIVLENRENLSPNELLLQKNVSGQFKHWKEVLNEKYDIGKRLLRTQLESQKIEKEDYKEKIEKIEKARNENKEIKEFQKDPYRWVSTTLQEEREVLKKKIPGASNALERESLEENLKLNGLEYNELSESFDKKVPIPLESIIDTKNLKIQSGQDLTSGNILRRLNGYIKSKNGKESSSYRVVGGFQKEKSRVVILENSEKDRMEMSLQFLSDIIEEESNKDTKKATGNETESFTIENTTLNGNLTTSVTFSKKDTLVDTTANVAQVSNNSDTIEGPIMPEVKDTPKIETKTKVLSKEDLKFQTEVGNILVYWRREWSKRFGNNKIDNANKINLDELISDPLQKVKETLSNMVNEKEGEKSRTDEEKVIKKTEKEIRSYKVNLNIINHVIGKNIPLNLPPDFFEKNIEKTPDKQNKQKEEKFETIKDGMFVKIRVGGTRNPIMTYKIGMIKDGVVPFENLTLEQKGSMTIDNMKKFLFDKKTEFIVEEPRQNNYKKTTSIGTKPDTISSTADREEPVIIEQATKESEAIPEGENNTPILADELEEPIVENINVKEKVLSQKEKLLEIFNQKHAEFLIAQKNLRESRQVKTDEGLWKIWETSKARVGVWASLGFEDFSEILKMISGQAQNLSSGGDDLNIGKSKAYEGTVGEFGKELVDAAIKKFPKPEK